MIRGQKIYWAKKTIRGQKSEGRAVWRVPRSMQQKYTVLMWCNYWIKCLYTVCLLLNRYSTSRRRTLQVFFKRIDLVVYITQQFVLVKPIAQKREREAPLSWYTPRMLDDMFYIGGVKLQTNFHLTQFYRYSIGIIFKFTQKFRHFLPFPTYN